VNRSITVASDSGEVRGPGTDLDSLRRCHRLDDVNPHDPLWVDAPAASSDTGRQARLACDHRALVDPALGISAIARA